MSIQIPERQWDEPPPVPHPAPLITSRPSTDDEIPRAAQSVRKLAEAHGWHVEAQYARGSRPGRTVRVVDSIALRMRRDGTRMWAVWLDGKFGAGQILRPGAIPVIATLTAIREELKS